MCKNCRKPSVLLETIIPDNYSYVSRRGKWESHKINSADFLRSDVELVALQ
jgi:hypothetical protein